MCKIFTITDINTTCENPVRLGMLLHQQVFIENAAFILDLKRNTFSGGGDATLVEGIRLKENN